MWSRLRKMCVGEPANSLIVSCGLSNGLNMLYKSRGSVLCVHRSFDHNWAWILMIARMITFTAGNGDLVRPSYHTSYAGIINRAVLLQRRSAIRFEPTLSTRPAFLHNKLHFLGTTAYQILQSGHSLWCRPGLNWHNVRAFTLNPDNCQEYILSVSKSHLNISTKVYLFQKLVALYR